MSYSTQEFAENNGIQYIPTKIGDLLLPDHKPGVNALHLAVNRCIILHPPVDGMPTCPIEFYRRAKGGRYIKVMDNIQAFKEISNISEILLQIANLYERFIDEPIFLDPNCFTITLIDPISWKR